MILIHTGEYLYLSYMDLLSRFAKIRSTEIYQLLALPFVQYNMPCRRACDISRRCLKPIEVPFSFCFLMSYVCLPTIMLFIATVSTQCPATTLTTFAHQFTDRSRIQSLQQHSYAYLSLWMLLTPPKASSLLSLYFYCFFSELLVSY